MSGSNFTLTPKLGLFKPTFNSDVDAWGGHWNANADTLDGLLPVAGGTMTGPLNYTATGSTASRSAQDRADDWVNVKDFGAKVDGTTSDSAAVGAALASLVPNQGIYFPSGTNGTISLTWGAVQGTTPATPVLFQVDGTMSGGSPLLRAFNRNNKGDVFETFQSGLKILSKASAETDSAGVLRVDHTNTGSVGSAGFVSTPIRVNATDWTGAVDSMWGVHVALTSNSNQPTWPQNVGVSSTLLKYGAAWCAGMHITASDRQNLPSSTGGTMLGFEIGYHTNAADDTFNGTAWGNAGTRMGIHLSLSAENTSGVVPAEISFGILADGNANAIVKSPYAVGNAMRTYQVFDARGATAPTGYTDPVAAVRMLAGQIVDFNGGPALNSAAGNYLKYDSATSKLLYYVGGVAKWSVDASGNMRCAGTVTGSVTP